MKNLRLPKGPYCINIDGVGNARALGGMMTESGKLIKDGLLYRSGELDCLESIKITKNGIKTALNQLKIKTDLDFRKTEQVPVGDFGPLGKNVQRINFSSLEYADFVKGESNEADIMRIFADINNYPILFHCKWGADRTGTVAYLLEMLVGVNEEIRLKDYELTSSRDRTHVNYRTFSAYLQENVLGKTDQEKAYTIFSKNFGLTEMEISNIKNILLTDSAIFASASLTAPTFIEKGVYSFELIMRNSKSVKAVEYASQRIRFEFNGTTLTLLGVNPTNSGIGSILFDDESKLNFSV